MLESDEKMIKKVDLVMWAKNSASLLPLVLKRIGEVIPSGFVGKMIIVDDHSEDNTVEVAESFGWKVYKNRGRGIEDAIDTALSYVTADFFVSVEHDVVLSKDWWEKISKYMEDESVAVAQGVRVATHPVLRKLDEYIIERKDERGNIWISIDNNIYRTAIIRKLGINLGCHSPLRRKIEEMGMKWIIDRNVISGHIKSGILPFIRHAYKMHKRTKGKRLIMFRIFLTSPLRALHIAFKKKCPQMVVIYPVIRLAILKASLEKGKTPQISVPSSDLP